MSYSGQKMPDSKLALVWIYFDTASFDEIERDKKMKFETLLSLIGGTMARWDSSLDFLSSVELR